MTRRFLMMTTREIESVAESEREALLRMGGLGDSELINVRLERDPFPNIDLRHWDGVIMCGSAYDVSTPEDEKSLKQKDIEKNLSDLGLEMIEQDFPCLAICYGLGLMTRALGGKVGPEISEDIWAPTLTVTPQGRRDPILEGVPDRFRAYLGHHESVIEKPEQMVTLVTGPVAPVQMGRIGSNVYLTQFHPELDFAGISNRIETFADYGYYPPEDRAAVEERVAGVDVSHAHKILWNFVQRFSSRTSAA